MGVVLVVILFDHYHNPHIDIITIVFYKGLWLMSLIRSCPPLQRKCGLRDQTGFLFYHFIAFISVFSNTSTKLTN